MSTTIRLTRMGRKKHPFYRLIVTDSRNRRDGAFIANLGYYNPFIEPLEVKLHDQEIIAWLKKGATTSSTAKSLMKREGVLYRWELERSGLAQNEIDAKVAAWKADFDGRIDNREQAKIAAAAKAKAEAIAAEKKAAEEAAAAEAAEKKAAEEAAAAEAAEAAAETPAETTDESAEAPADTEGN